MREKQTAVRLENDMMERIKALLGPMTDDRGPATISGVLREATAAGLPLLEKKYKVPTPKKEAVRTAERPKPVGRRGGKREAVES